MADHDAITAEFCGLTGASPEKAQDYLAMYDWDLNAASMAYLEDLEEPTSRTGAGAESQAEAQTADEDYTGPRTLDGRPAPQAATGTTSKRKTASQPKKRGVATLASLGGGSSSRHHDDDDDDEDAEDDQDDGRGNLFAGGEKSGLAVQDPNPDGGGGGGGPRKIISDILAKAKANASRPDAASEAGPSEDNRFRGTGMTLGGDGTESRSIPDPQGPTRSSNQEPQERVLHVWQDGFSIDDGELRRFDDPANQMDLQLIRSGRAPLHLMNIEHDQPVDVKLNQHDTPYVPQPKKYRPFGGSGQRLGSPVPGDGNDFRAHVAPISALETPGSAEPLPRAPMDGSLQVDSSQPTLMIRIQMPDGSRLPARFNTTHTIGDIYSFVHSSSLDTRSRSWVLATTFPSKEHTDKSAVLGEVPEFKKGGTAVVKWT